MTYKERKVQKYLVDKLRKYGCVVTHTVTQDKGFPDLCIIAPRGRSAYIELKVEGGRVSLQQRRTICKLRELKHVALILHIVDKIPKKKCKPRGERYLTDHDIYVTDIRQAFALIMIAITDEYGNFY